MKWIGKNSLSDTSLSDITSVIAGTGLSGGGTTGDVTLNVNVNHDSLAGFVAAEHVDWAGASAGTIHITNIPALNQDTTGAAAFSELAAQATILATARAINGVDFNGSAAITVRAAAATLTGNTLNSSVVTSSLTSVGTIGSGVWNGTAVASAYLDADTAHLSGTQTFTGTKTLNSFKGTGGATVTNILDEDAMGSNSATALATQQSIKAYADRPAGQVVMMRAGFKGDVATTKYYIPLQAELEQTTYNHETNGFLAPFPGKLLKVMYRASGNLSGSSNSVTFRLEQVPRNVSWTTPTVLETIAVNGPTNDTTDPNMVTANFVGGDGTNVFAAGDTIMVSMQHSADVAASATRHFFTLVFEMDYSGLA